LREDLIEEEINEHAGHGYVHPEAMSSAQAACAYRSVRTDESQIEPGASAKIFAAPIDLNNGGVAGELNPPPGRPSLPQEGKNLHRRGIDADGLEPSCARAFEASVVELGS
jgi:hypothetical protein